MVCSRLVVVAMLSAYLSFFVGFIVCLELHRLLAAVVRFSISIRLFCNLFRILVNFSFFSQYHSTCCLF